MSQLAPAPSPLLPPLAVGVCITCLAGASALSYCALLTALIKQTKRGLFLIILQLAIADFLLLATSVWPELLSCNARTWNFGKYGCSAHRGFSVFASTASMYLTATVALHMLATNNVHEKKIKRRLKRGDLSGDVYQRNEDAEDLRSSCNSLVANSDSSTPRTMNVDYRLTEDRVPVKLPSVFVWILSASLSIPDFTLSTIVNIDHNIEQCTLVDSQHQLNLYWIFSIGNLSLSTTILLSLALLIIYKIITSKKNISKEISAGLKLSLRLIIVHIVLCVPRLVFNIYGAFSNYNFFNQISLSNVTKQQGNVLIMISLALGIAYQMATVIRPLICVLTMPSLRKVFSVRGKKRIRSNNDCV